mgnify:CR=1 FL=1
MPQFSGEFWMQLVLYGLSIGVIYGGVRVQLKDLAEKVNKHNNLIERMYRVEESAKSAHKRIDELREETDHA